jgi:hypothetical protein
MGPPEGRQSEQRVYASLTRSHALALVSREQGQIEYSDHLAQLASEVLLRAEEIERSIGNGRAVC